MEMEIIDEMKTVDVCFDFTTDTKGYWERYEGTDLSRYLEKTPDPDVHSKTLRRCHRILWSRALPNGEQMSLEESNSEYLSWNGCRFGSDSMTNSFRYERMQPIITEFKTMVPDYRAYMENCIRKLYTIGGEIIFPKHGKTSSGSKVGGTNSINQARGCNRCIMDRWDRSLECIRLYYEGERSPLYRTLEEDSWFFDKFIDFDNYVDFFFLQDCVDEDYNVIPWINDLDFDTPALPKDSHEYSIWMQANMDFVEKRNKRIDSFITGI